MPPKRKLKITARALLDIRTPSDVQVAPDGVRVVYAVPEIDWDDNVVPQHLYLRNANREEDAPRQLTRGEGSESSPRWSPDGKWLAFLTAREDAEDSGDDEACDEVLEQVWLLPMDGGGGEAYKLTNVSAGVGDFDWLPDSSGIIYLAKESRPKALQSVYDNRHERKDDAAVVRQEKFRQQIWRIDIEGKKNKLIHPGDYGIGEIAASPDGARVAFTTNYTGEPNDYHKSDLFVLDVGTGKVTQLTDGPGGKYRPTWAIDGGSIYFYGNSDPLISYSQSQLFSVDLASTAISNVTEHFPHDLCGWPGIGWDSQGRIYVTAAIGTSTALFRFKGDDYEAVIRNHEHIHSFHVAPSGSIAYIAGDLNQAPEVYWLHSGSVDSVALTDLNDEWLDQYALAETEVVTWPSNDGVQVEGLLTYPIGYDPSLTYPLIISLHGGPHGRIVQTTNADSTEQVYAAEGYAVLSPNYRGSEGYGNEFSMALRGDIGGSDYQDVLSGVDWAIEQGLADPDRLGIIGSSYGAYLVNWAIGHTDRFKAAVSKFGIFSLVTDFSNSAVPRWEEEYLGATYWDDPMLYADKSPASFVKQINTPVLLMHGEEDPNTFIANSQEMYTALRLQGKTVEYVRFPREGHGFSEPSHYIDEVHKTIAWFDRYVVGGGQLQTYRVGDVVTEAGWELRVVSATVENYAGHEDKLNRFVEIVFVLREIGETGAALILSPADVSLTRGLSSSGRSGRPVGVPVDVLGQKILAEGQGWRFNFKPAGDQRALTVPVAVTFRISNAGGTLAFSVKDFPPVTIEMSAAEEKEDESE